MSLLLNAVRSFKSIHARNCERLLSSREISSVVLVGSSCAGKTTIIDAIREAGGLDTLGICIPVRYVTRPPRQADNFVENRHVTPEKFRQMVRKREIGLNWVREMEGGRREEYGFQSVPKRLLPLYSGNNALYDNPDSIRPSDALNDALFVGVFAPDSVRRERLVRRSPDLVAKRPEEVQYRLGDSSRNMLPHVHVVVRNYGIFEEIACREVVAMLKAIVEFNGSAAVVPN